MNRGSPGGGRPTPSPDPAGETETPDVQRRWDLWHLRTLFPRWGDEERDRLLELGARHDRRQQELFKDPVEAYRRFGPGAARVLRRNPEMASGLTISLHLGPYSLAPVPWLMAGQNVHLLVNRASLATIGPIYDELQAGLELPGSVIWIPIEGRGFVMRLWRALRRGEPAFAYLDGNDGLAGSEGTLQHGIRHSLPGRDIRVRSGLARIATRLRCPVHSLVTVWDDLGNFKWQRGPTWRWRPDRSAARLTTEMFTWGFGVIKDHPAQWRAWNMLTGCCDSFRKDSEVGAPAQALADSDRLMTAGFADCPLTWRREALVWPGDMIEDVRGACFYAANGLRAEQVAYLKGLTSFSRTQLVVWWGRDWVDRHLRRLIALGFVGSTR